MSSLVGMIKNRVYPFISYLMSEYCTKPVPPVLDSFIADIDATLMEQIFDVAQWKLKPYKHQYSKADDLVGSFQIKEWVFILYSKTLWKYHVAVKMSILMTVT